MIKRLLFILFITICSIGKSQCPQFYDYLGNLTSNPTFVYCSTGAYNMALQSPTAFGPYTINWGDGTPNTVGVANAANNPIGHTYAASVNTFVLTLTIPSASCTRTMLVVMEQAVAAGAQNFGGVTTFCAPGSITVTNISTNVSPTTIFTWDWGDGTPVQTFNYTNQNQNLTHTFAAGSVINCQRTITLTASNYCRPIPNPINLHVDIYDIDQAAITPDAPTRCFPDNQFTFTNSTNRNCVPEGNTFQRQERWNLGNYWGYGHDSIINWRPWPPTTPLTVSYPAVGVYTVMLVDSNKCGKTSAVLAVNIVNSPTAGVIVPGGVICQNTSITFTNSSTVGGYSYRWDFGDGAGLQNLGAGDKAHTYTTPGTYTVRVVAMLPGATSSACTSTASATVTVISAPSANFTLSPAAGCTSLASVSFTDLSVGASTYTWNYGNGTISNSSVPPSTSYTTTGNFTASLSITGTTSCINTKTLSVIVRPTPVPNFPPISPCVGAVGNFTSTSTVTGTNAITSYTWDFGDATPLSNAQNPAHTYTAAGTYSVKLTASTAFCSDVTTKTINVNVKPTASFVIAPFSDCPPFTPTLTNLSANAVNYLWRFGTVPTATSNLATPSYTYNNSTQNFLNYTVTLIASTASGCADSTNQSLSVKPKPVAGFNVSTSGGCSPLATTFTNNSVGATTYSWSFGDATSSTSVNPTHFYNNSTVLLQTNTITLVATNSINCSDTSKQTIQIFPQPLTTFTMSPGAGCNPLTINFPSVPGTVSYTWNFGDGSPQVVAVTPTLHVFTNTTTATQFYTVTLTASNAFGCVASSAKVPTVYPVPTASFVTTSTIGCSPLSATLTNLSNIASNYLWDFGDGVNSTSVNATHEYTNTSYTNDQTFTCTLIAYSIYGCSDTIKKKFLVYNTPLSSFTLDAPGCASSTISFTNTSIGNAINSWSFGDVTPVSTVVSPAHTYTNNTINNLNFTVQLTVSSAHGCSDVAYAYPVIYAHPAPNFGLSPAAGCSPLSTTMTNVSLYAHSYMWRFGDNTPTVTTTNASHTYYDQSNTADQTFTCTLVAFNNNGCKDSIKNNVIVYFKPHATFTLNAPGCTSSTISFTNTSAGNTSPKWTFGDGTPTVSVVSPVHTFTNTTLNNVTYTTQLVLTTGNLCRDTAYRYPVIFARPTASFVMTPTSGCTPMAASFTNSSTQAHAYLWKFGDGATTIATSTTHVYNNSSNISNLQLVCTLIAYNNNGCKDSVKQTVWVNYKPKADFTQNDPKCTSQTINFTNNSIGAAIYGWNLGDNTPISTVLNPTHNYTNTTINNITYTVMLVAASASLCTDTAYGYPVIYAKPIAQALVTPTLGCSPLTATMLNSSSAAHSYLWRFGDGASSTQSNTAHTYTNTSNLNDQTFFDRLIAYNNNGCKDSINVSLLLYFRPKSVFSLDTPACTPKLITFSNNSIGAISYKWNFGDGSVATTSNTTHQYVNNTPFNQTYSVSLISTSSSTCRDTLIVPMTVHPRPHFEIAPQPLSGCSPLTVFFPKLVGVTYYQWYYDNNIGFGNSGDITSTFINTGSTTKTFNVKLIAKDIYSCPDTPSTVIQVFPSPIAKFLASPLSVYIPDQATYMTNLSAGATSYTWSFGDGGTSTDQQPTHTYTTAGEYQIVLIAQNAGGCLDTFKLDQRVIALAETTVRIPNAFTPKTSGSPGNSYSDDTDRRNEIFHPNVKGAEKYELTIYSRWGELLFATQNPLEGWDGYYKGQLCMQDVYIWKVVATFLDGRVYNKTGDLLLVR